jgi:hypothetical protein
MSGAAGLSSARRRRAGGQGNTSTNSSNQQVTSNSSQNNQDNNRSQPVSHMQVLNLHEIRIRQIMEKVEGMHNTITSTEKSSNNDNAQYASLVTRITNLEKNYNSANNTEDIAYFKNKTQELEGQVTDMKRLLLKVQSFAMEAHLSSQKKQIESKESLEEPKESVAESD